MRLSDVSIIIVTYNHRNYIKTCIESLIHDDLEIIIVDNKSMDGTPEYVEKNFPEVKLIRNPENSGYGVGNNIGVNYSTRNYIVILNPDTKVASDAIINLVLPLENSTKLITTPKVLFYDGSAINTCGNIEHFTGLSFTRGLNESPNKFNKQEYINGISGVCFAIRKSEYIELGGFNEKFLVYMEDAELSWRANSQGYKIIFSPNSIIYHDYKLKVPPEKIYHLEKGRYIILRKYFTRKDYLIMFPSLIMTEIFTTGYSFLNGLTGIKYKLKALNDGLTIDVIKIYLNRKDLFKCLDPEIPKDQLNKGTIDLVLRKIGNYVYKLNFKLIK